MVDDKDRDTYASAPTEVATPASANPATADTVTSEANELLHVELAPTGYQLGSLLGKGGMGEVIAAQDLRVGREVAYKRMRNREVSADALSRFLREARIQARLDHPSIVPVYELGTDQEGRPFFTMKRLAGKTLAERLQDSAEPLQPLLRAFAEVCLAIELAHSRGIVHRDLKPSNVMLGDFGEVYVLDWGVARVLTERARMTTGADPIGDLDSIGEATAGGSLLGTVGYMPPEQLRGEDVDGKADVYALGSILFEILAGEPLHPRGHAAVASTLSMGTASPADRRPDRVIPPELDSLCCDMVTADRDARPSVREVAQRVQKYLDGDRDHEARRALARTYLVSAREILDAGDPLRRAEALRAAGRALALDPHSTEAADLVTRMIVEPPKEHPPELVRTLQEHEAALIRARARRAMWGYLSVLWLSGFLVLFHISSWPTLIGMVTGILAIALLSHRTTQTGRANLPAMMIGTAVMAVLLSRIASPLVLVPALLCGTMMSASNVPYLNERPTLLYVWILACGTLPLVLEWTGVISPTLFVEAAAIEIRSAVFAPSGWIAMPVLAVANALFLLIVARFAIMIASDRRATQRTLTIQAWHLGHLLPETPQVVAAPRATHG